MRSGLYVCIRPFTYVDIRVVSIAGVWGDKVIIVNLGV